ncbi:hypothetical protein [Acinetobacter rudis]|uniref:Uncharacterized protein n=1 Tax=Acinetobacter rudis TaxID=632955 RepID=A0AAW8J821_9GAMM|nr:hypothetical protein [Acinetobacter rudis]MDQ8935267.1 hypothetical protein [Acinetobacter rudis]MDQ8952732.1 hypothetical protein [Acinetobacter rudis]MDQ9017538.1 hypothetical protein [Acinetobacter rudis]
MKALFWSDEINQTHWTMLKSALLILSLLPVSHILLQLWQGTEGASQIVVGFVAVTALSSLTILGFISALFITVLKLKHNEVFTLLEQRIMQIYRYFPMFLLTVMLSYLSFDFAQHLL